MMREIKGESTYAEWKLEFNAYMYSEDKTNADMYSQCIGLYVKRCEVEMNPGKLCYGP